MADLLLHKSALEQAALIREGALSSAELCRLYLERIERLNPKLWAFTHVDAEGALAEARRKDEARGRGGAPAAPFDGVPLGIKDLNVVRGMPTGWGSRAVPRLSLPFDDATVAQLRRGGFVMLGKLATSELGALPMTEPDTHPPTRNPWNPEHTSGGSSGGSAAAVAAGLLPIAQGSDGAGSIRIPASFCHLYGFKPSRGRLRHPFGLPDRSVIYTMGPLARSVGDAAAMLDVMAGLSEGRPHWAPRPARPFAELAREKPGRLRIHFSTRSPLGPTHPEVAAATERVARTLAELGHEVVEGPPLQAELSEFLPIWQHLTAQMPVPPWRWSRAQPVTRWLAEPGRRLRGAEVAALQQRMEARLRQSLGGADVWLLPTVVQPPPRVGSLAGKGPAEAFAEAAQLGALTAPYNVLGWPAASIPVGLTSEGLPMGVQLGGCADFADAQVLALSRQLEEALPWAERRAPGFDAA